MELLESQPQYNTDIDTVCFTGKAKTIKIGLVSFTTNFLRHQDRNTWKNTEDYSCLFQRIPVKCSEWYTIKFLMISCPYLEIFSFSFLPSGGCTFCHKREIGLFCDVAVSRNSCRLNRTDLALARWWQAFPGSWLLVLQSALLLPKHRFALSEQKVRWCKLFMGACCFTAAGRSGSESLQEVCLLCRAVVFRPRWPGEVSLHHPAVGFTPACGKLIRTKTTRWALKNSRTSWKKWTLKLMTIMPRQFSR